MISDVRRRQRPVRSRPHRRAAPPQAMDDIPQWLLVVLIAAWAGIFMAIGWIVDGYVDLLRWITGGNATAMAVAGWLVFFAPFGLGWALLLFRRRLPLRVRQVLAVAALFQIPVVAVLFPTTENWGLIEAADGVGGAAFIAGVLNGSLAAVVPCAVVPFIALNRRLRDAVGDRLLRNVLIPPVVTFLIATLVAAIIFGQS